MISADPGYPAIPIIRRILTAEPQNISIKILSADTVLLDQMLIPIAEPVTKSDKREYIYKPQLSVYNSDELLIGQRYAVKQLGNRALLEIYPFDYMPAANMLIIYTMNIEYDINGFDQTSVNNNNMIVIYNDDFSDVISSMELFFMRRNKHVNAFPLSITGSTSDSIISFLRGQFSTEPFSFLLIMGDSRMVPGAWGLGDGTPYTDIYYSTADASDYLPDLLVSRLPFDSSYKFTEFISKVELSLGSGAAEMRNKAYFMASNDPGNHLLAESTQIYSMERFRDIGFVTDSLFYYYNTGTPVEDALNEGRTMAFYTGHGIAYQWSGPPFNAYDIDSLSNSPYFPYIFSFACLTGNYFYTTYFGGQWLDHGNGGGIGFIGSSQETYWEQDDILQRYFVDSLVNDKYVIEAFNSGKTDFLQYYGDNQTTKRYFEQYNYFSVPDIYLGNFNIDNIYIYSDKYEPYTNGYVSLNIEFEGMPDKHGYACIYADSLIDSATVSAAGIYNFYHNNMPGDTINASLYFPGRLMEESNIILIDNGPYAAVKDYAVSDIVSDTVKFDITVKNFGNAVADDISVFLNYVPDYMTLSHNDLYIDSMLPESALMVNNALIFTVEDNAGAGSDTLCTVGTVSGSDTIYSYISVSNLIPSFNADFLYAICGMDTSNALTIGKVCNVYFTVENTSSFKAKNIHVSIDGAFTGVSTEYNCDSLMPGQKAETAFALIPVDPDSNMLSLNMHVSMGSFEQNIEFKLLLRLKNSYSFLGPVMGYYLYTADMIDLENRPQFSDVRTDEKGWKTLPFDDDETAGIDLPFFVRIDKNYYDKLYLNANGVLSTDSIESALFGVTTLPSSSITGRAFVCAWNDYRFSDVNYLSDNINDLKGSVLYKSNDLGTSMTILYNNVTDYEDDTFAFAIVIDTADITVHYYKIPFNNNLVTGFQFSPSQYLTFTGDSFSTSAGIDLIRDSLSISINDKLPRPITKYSAETYTENHAPLLMSSPVAGNSELIIGIFEPDIYSIDIYDITGRNIANIHNGLLVKGNYHFSSKIQASGMYFIRICNRTECLLSRRITIIY